MDERTRKLMFSSMSGDWRTPKAVYDKLDREFQFNFDPCPANPDNNGLFIPWKERNFINPPYSEVKRWVQKAWAESMKGKLCVLLTAARTDTRWFHRFVLPYHTEIRFLEGRIYFIDKDGVGRRAPFPSMVVVFDGRRHP